MREEGKEDRGKEVWLPQNQNLNSNFNFQTSSWSAQPLKYLLDTHGNQETLGGCVGSLVNTSQPQKVETGFQGKQAKEKPYRQVLDLTERLCLDE